MYSTRVAVGAQDYWPQGRHHVARLEAGSLTSKAGKNCCVTAWDCANNVGQDDSGRQACPVSTLTLQLPKTGS